MRDENQRAVVFFQRHVQGFDTFHVHVVGRFVHDQNIGFQQQQFAVKHTAFFATGENLHFFHDIVAAEEQAAQSAADDLFVIAFLAPLTHPFAQVHIDVKVVFMVLRVVADTGFFRPFDGAFVRQQAV